MTMTTLSATAVNRHAAHVEQRERDHQRGPGGRLHRGGDAQRQPGGDQVGPLRPPEQREAEAHERDHRHVGTADAQFERDDRRGRHQQRPPEAVPGSGNPQRDGEYHEEHGAEPDPRIGEQAVAEQRLRHAERRHQRQVRVVLVGVGGVGQRLRAPVRGAVLDERRGGAGHDADLGFPVAVGDHPEQREQDGAAEDHAERDVDAAGTP
jgi:hypothetical protein